jgi:D-alanyl-lipoteichoic acid acyltransferase DltB (MBOAT superfamily)
MLIDREKEDRKKKIWMRVNIILILLPLFFFKYFGEINNQLIDFLRNYGFNWAFPEMTLLLPIGISFYTFMAIGYTVDVYNEEVEFERNVGKLALFISFFPLILSGPIERAKNMLPQFTYIGKINYSNLTSGLKMMLWGYFLKLVVADRIGIYVDAVYNNLIHHNGTTLLFTSFLYPFQVYADLGGYSLIAIGVSKALGFNVIQNFNRPFFAKSMSDFWRRWHISLISWLTDYIYTPLSFSLRKYKIWGIVMALMLTFFISGIWHGASMTFVAWGILQGIFLSLEALINKRKMLFETKFKLVESRSYLAINIVITFILFAISQVYARSESIIDAHNIFTKIFTNQGSLFIGTPATLIYVGFGLILMIMNDYLFEYKIDKFILFKSNNIILRYLSISFTVILIILFGVLDGGQFIYFQF